MTSLFKSKLAVAALAALVQAARVARVAEVDCAGALGRHDQGRHAVILVGQRDIRRIDRDYLIVGPGDLVLRRLRRTRAGRVRIRAAEHARAADADIGARPGTGAEHDGAEVEIAHPGKGERLHDARRGGRILVRSDRESRRRRQRQRRSRRDRRRAKEFDHVHVPTGSTSAAARASAIREVGINLNRFRLCSMGWLMAA